MHSDRTLKAWYREINTRFFDNELPDSTCVRWSNETEADRSEDTRYFGWCDYVDGRYVIVLSRPKNKDWIIRMSTLVHEMLHVATELRDDHGPAFERWRQHISDKGIFKKHALRKNRVLF